MILKFMHPHKVGSYTLRDNVDRVTHSYDSKENCIVLAVDFKGESQGTLIPIDGVVYVCNNDGKTIDIIYPDVNGITSHKNTEKE